MRCRERLHPPRVRLDGASVLLLRREAVLRAGLRGPLVPRRPCRTRTGRSGPHASWMPVGGGAERAQDVTLQLLHSVRQGAQVSCELGRLLAARLGRFGHRTQLVHREQQGGAGAPFGGATPSPAPHRVPRRARPIMAPPSPALRRRPGSPRCGPSRGPQAAGRPVAVGWATRARAAPTTDPAVVPARGRRRVGLHTGRRLGQVAHAAGHHVSHWHATRPAPVQPCAGPLPSRLIP